MAADLTDEGLKKRTQELHEAWYQKAPKLRTLKFSDAIALDHAILAALKQVRDETLAQCQGRDDLHGEFRP